MKTVFVGPSLSEVHLDFPDLEFHGPAVQGDIYKVVRAGTKSIGLIDGCFETVGSVWHKEILYALSLGVSVFGASSMGALRAAECQSFGMIPVGKIANAYASGQLDDDAAVALTSLPAEADYLPLVEPMVDVWPTLENLENKGVLTTQEHEKVKLAAENIFFKDRTIEAIASCAPTQCGEIDLTMAYKKWRVPQKRIDAFELLQLMQSFCAPEFSINWKFEPSPFWNSMVDNIAC